jgi:hypothetical protein
MTTLSKPLTRSVIHPRMPHGYRDRLIITVHPGAIIEVREARRRQSVRLDLGILYVKELIRLAREQQRKRGRRGTRSRSSAR